MLWLAILARDTGSPASWHLGIKDEVVALDFDLAVSHRLFRLQTDERKDLARRIAYECGRMFFGGSDIEETESEGGDLVAADPFADETTTVW